MVDSDDDSVFNDELDDFQINQLLDKDTNITTNRYKLQRNLYGEVIPDQHIYEELETSEKPVIFPPTHHIISYDDLSTYIYPTNFEVRDYQFNIVAKAFYDNLLVALPTGLGKTFIASTVMLNFLRWFPNSKIIFMAPTRPLVAQQIKACCGVTGITSSKVAILLDKTKRNRKDVWDSKNVFFTTPQVVENDLASGIVDPKSIVLLVIDEAHRARGNYAYNNVVKFLKRFNQSFRILALTATPASDIEGVQEIIDNLDISKVEVRTERSIDISKYMKHKRIVRRTVLPSDDILHCIDLLSTAIEPVLKLANERNIYSLTDSTKINAFQCMDASQKLIKNPTIPEGLKWSNFFILQLLGVVGQCYRRLNIYGIKSFFGYFKEKHLEFTTKWTKKKSTNKINADFYFNDSIKSLLAHCENHLKNESYISHPKLECLINELDSFFEEKKSVSSKVIIFTEFRESALEIVTSLENLDSNLKPHIFIGQSKEKDKFDEEKYLKKNKKSKSKEIEKNKLSTSNVKRSSSEDAQLKGMNQKLQKEIIRKFNSGEYNVLVATSIGEEGLDISEVDLIVCYDSTSSPIKNIQRMGRTGRKREGKVLLLFSSNEESKFDKAMGGYEYIQQHIMKGDSINLANTNRIIPNSFQPIVQKQFIKIPEENLEIKAEEDDDEIIRIATNYMMGKTKTKSSRNTNKIDKKFFMPDNVDIGFKSVISMVRKVNSTDSSSKPPKSKDTLDKILSSDSEDDLFSAANLRTSSRIEELNGSIDCSNKSERSTKNSGEYSDLQRPSIRKPCLNIVPEKANPDCTLSDNNKIESQSTTTNSESMNEFLSNVQGNLSKNYDPKENLDEEINKSVSKLQRGSRLGVRRAKNLTAPDPTSYSLSRRNNKATLGLKKRRLDYNIIDQLKQQHSKIIQNASDETINVDDFDDIDELLFKNKLSNALPTFKSGSNEVSNGTNQTIELKEGGILESSSQANQNYSDNEDDVFNDGLEDVLVSIENYKSLPLEKAQLQYLNARNESQPEELYKNSFDEKDGVLNNDQLTELYTSYFTTIALKDLTAYYKPFLNIKLYEKNPKIHHGSIGHGKASKLLLNHLKFNQSISNRKAATLNEIHSQLAVNLDFSEAQCIRHMALIINEDS